MEEVSWTNVHSQDARIQAHSFWRAIDVWWRKPHVINRRIVAAVEEHRFSGLSESASPESLAGLSLVGPQGKRSYEQWHGGLLKDFKHLASQEENKTSFSHCIDRHFSIFKHSKSEDKLPNEQLSNTQNDEKLDSAEGMGEDVNVSTLLTENEELPLLDKTRSHTFVIGIRKLLSKRVSDVVVYEMGIFDHQRNEATFILLESGIREPSFPSYKFSFQCNRISLMVDDNYSSVTCSSSIRSVEWLASTLAPKVIQWAREDRGSEGTVGVKALVPMDRYAELYQGMKQKYGTEFVKIWPENTDPKKFVYEDVAIATYLLLLFEEERKETGNDKKQSFVDLGCGNGLLVHILNSEGHPGKGIDLRRRKIWNLYGPETHLEESTIIASMETSFKDTDWLIGNHSDELTPWIPVMAARSSYSSHYFVLPCCFHDFDHKFSQRVAGQAQYRTYLDFVREAGEMCGFKVEEDRMRIPSTKRVCHVGRRKTCPAEEHPQILERIEKYVAGRCRRSVGHPREPQPSDSLPNSESSRTCGSSSRKNGCSADSKDAGSTHSRDVINSDASLAGGCCIKGEQEAHKNLAPGFMPRAVEERVKNCARVEKSLKDRIMSEVAWAILEDGGVKRSSDDGQGMMPDGEDEGDTGRSKKVPKLWRRGGSISLGDAAKLFDRPTLKNLKSECGGLKTLLRNYNQVFEILGNKVSLKDWSKMTASEATNPLSSSSTSSKTASQKLDKKDRERQQLYKTKLCWFHEHHPDGCPRAAEACPFAHGQAELRSRPAFEKGP